MAKAPGKNATKLMNMTIDAGDGPEADMEKMTDAEQQLFIAVTAACVQAVHKTHPIQQAANMEAFFASTCRSALFFAGLHVREYRKLKEEFKK